jgi:hypothetical protein
MNAPPLLAVLADRFVPQRENLATEALAHVLGRSDTARSAAIQTFRRLGANLPDPLMFRTQAYGPDQVIPDLVGEDAKGVQQLIIEAKFWAGLTESQPVQYLQRIQQQGSGTLAFIVPAQRAELLWNELLRRCSSAGIKVADTSVAGSSSRFGSVRAGASLCLVSWNNLIENIRSELERAGEHLVASDLAQLQGLCEREDAKAFLPLTSEELTGTTPQRVIQFCELVDEIAEHLVKKRVADIKGLKSSGGNGWYGRYMRIHGFGCFLQFSALNWRDRGATPLWLRIEGQEWRPNPQLIQHLSRLAKAKNIPAVPTKEGVEYPLFLPTHLERERVFQCILDQLDVAITWLRDFKSPNQTR